MYKLLTPLIAAACVSFSGCAELAAFLPEAPPPTDARVVGLYVQLAPGLMMERTGSSVEAALPQFAELRTVPRDGQPSRLVMVPLEDAGARLGDNVTVALGERNTGLLTGPRAAQSRIVRVQAPERTLVQRLFGL